LISWSSVSKVSHTTETHSLSLHDALPIYNASCTRARPRHGNVQLAIAMPCVGSTARRKLAAQPNAVERHTGSSSMKRILINATQDRKSTRLNSSHVSISYAVFCV